MLAVVSPDYFHSDECCAEVAAAVEAGITIIPVYDGDRFTCDADDSEVMQWSGSDTTHSTPELRHHVYNPLNHRLARSTVCNNVSP
mmetsp:Transcript_99089/g.137642  ORF Transcript_99089/g.137642 Transcript_99089/m.137642 type:complete len:86 (-) Transcript_99089:1060-1317(-)